MSVQVPADLEADILEKVEGGRYRDADDVLRTALRALDHREIRASIARGRAEIERGEGRELTPELMDEIEQAAAERVRLGIPPKRDVCP